MEIKIRAIKLEEVKEVVDLTNYSFNVPYKKEEYKQIYNDPVETLINEFKSGQTNVPVAFLKDLTIILPLVILKLLNINI